MEDPGDSSNDLVNLYEIQQRGEITTAHCTIDMISKLKFKPAPANAFLYFGSIVRRVDVLVKISEPLQAIDKYQFYWQLKGINYCGQESKNILIRFESDSIYTITPEARQQFQVGSYFRFVALPSLNPEFHLMVISAEEKKLQDPFVAYHHASCQFADRELKRLGEEHSKGAIDPSIKTLVRPGTEQKTLQTITDDIIGDLLKNQEARRRGLQKLIDSESLGIKNELPRFADFNRKEAFKMTKESKSHLLRKKQEPKKAKKKTPKKIPSDEAWLRNLLVYGN